MKGNNAVNLDTTFEARWTGRAGLAFWSARSPDLLNPPLLLMGSSEESRLWDYN